MLGYPGRETEKPAAIKQLEVRKATRVRYKGSTLYLEHKFLKSLPSLQGRMDPRSLAGMTINSPEEITSCDDRGLSEETVQNVKPVTSPPICPSK